MALTEQQTQLIQTHIEALKEAGADIPQARADELLVLVSQRIDELIAIQSGAAGEVGQWAVDLVNSILDTLFDGA